MNNIMTFESRLYVQYSKVRKYFYWEEGEGNIIPHTGLGVTTKSDKFV
jgi:hypothetical protein